MGRIYSIRIETRISTLLEFAKWRIKQWNIIDYRRRVSRWWSDLSFRVWLCGDGSVRGVVALGSITEDELAAALGTRWLLTLRQIDQGNVFDELYSVVQPRSIIADEPDHGRYQRRQLSVRPRRARTHQTRPVAISDPDPFDEPMPLLIA